MKTRFILSPLIGAFFLAALSSLPTCAAEPSVSEGPKPADLTNPREAGIRYGQAAGMAAVCENMTPTSKAEGLGTAFSGKDLEIFKVQAETVLQSWKKTLTCTHTNDPNPCRLANQLSCREGLREIGPTGVVAPGLIEVKTSQGTP